MRTGTVVVGLTCVSAFHATAQEADKVEQYRGMLLKRPENAVLFGRLVDAWLEKGEMTGLKEMLEAKAAAGGPMDWRLLAVFRNFAGDEAGAITALDEALKKAPEDPQTRLARAKALGAASRFEDALADLEPAAKDPASAMEAGAMRGKYLARAGRPVEAVKAWKEVIAAHPGDEGLREDLIELEIGEGLLDEAVAAAGELADETEDPYQKALRRMRVAEILSQAGKKNEAVEKYRDVFAVSAENSWLEREVLARVNALFSREDDTAGLRQFYDQLRETFPRRVAVKKEAARGLMLSGEGDEAVAMFREVLKVLPGDREARDEFIALLESAGRYKDAADEVSALLATADKDPVLWEKLAGIRKQLGDVAGLKEAVDKAVALMPADESGRISVAAVFERYGRPDDAERTLRDAAKTHGLAGEAGDALAVLLASRGKADEAVGLWREMAKTADREGLLRIVRSLTANGRAADAYGILSSRMAGFEGDPLLLAALCQSAQFADQAEGAIPQALDLVRQARTTGDLETALRQAIGIVFRAKEPRKWVDELAAKADPSTQELCLLAEMHETLGDSIAADQLLKNAMERGDALLAAAQRVRLFELRGDYAAAIIATREWIALPGGLRTEQVKRLVSLHERGGDTEAALKETENWKRIAPGDKLAWAKRAELFQTCGKSGEAVAELRRALAKFGAEEEMRAKLAAALSESGMVPEAWRMYYGLYDEAQSPATKLKWAASLAELAAREGREEELINDFKRRSRDNPSSVVPLLALAEMYREWQQPEEELGALSEASRRKPDDVSLLHRLADIEEETGSAEKAEALLRTAIRVQDTPDNRRRLSAFWIRGGDSERGLAELLANKAAASPRETERLVMPLANVKEWDSALGILAAEVPRHPDDWRLAYLYAHVLREADKKDEAFNRFAALLGAKGDLAGVLPLVPQNQMQWFTGGKPGISDFRLFTHLQRITGASNDRRQMYFGMNQSGVPMPGTVTEVRWMALCQALAIAGEKPETRTARLAALTAGDLPALEFIKSVHALKPEELRERMLADDADVRLFRWYAETRNNYPYQDVKSDLKVLRKGVDVCAGKDPELALMLMVNLPLDGEDGLGADGARRMLEIVSSLDAEKRAGNLMSLQKLAFASEKELPKDIRDKAETLMLADLKAIQTKSGNTWISDSLALQWMRAGRFDDAAALLNESYEFGKDPSVATARRQSMNAFGMHGFQMPGQQGALAFPAILASSVTPAFQSEFNVGMSGGAAAVTPAQKKLLDLLGEKAGTYPGQGEVKDPVDSEGLARMLPKIADPYQKVFFAQATGKPDVVEREIAAMEKARPEDPAALRIAAAYQLSVKKDTSEAYGLLTRACQFSKADAARDAMDWQLYQLGVGLAAKPPAGLDLEPARRAALRLRKSMSRDEDSKRKLAADLAKLGLEEESKRYTAAPKAIAGLRSSYGYSGRTSGRSQQQLNQQALMTLVSQGKREAAARRTLSELRRLKAVSAMNSNSNYEERQLHELIVSLRLADEIIRISQPAAGAGFASRREFALLLGKLKKDEQALPLLRALVAEKPDDLEVRSALLPALPKEEQKEYILTLTTGKIDDDRLGTWFNSVLQDRGERKFGDYIAGVEMFVMFLEKLHPSIEPERNLSWVNYLAKDLFEDDSFGEVSLKRFGREDRGSRKFDEAKTGERDALARRLYQAMLRHPQTCEQGFILMHGGSGYLKIGDDVLDKAARVALAASFRVKPDTEMQRMYGGNRSYLLWMWRTAGGGGTSNGQPNSGIDPMTYLIRQSAAGKGADPFSPEFLAELAKDESDLGKTFAECVKIVETPELDAFSKWKEKTEEEPQTASTELTWICRLAFFKKRGDILDAALEFACDLALGKVGTSSGGGSAGVSEVLALSISDAVGLEDKTKAIERITKRLLGPPEAWELYGDNERNQSLYRVQMRVGIYQQLCQSFQSNRSNLIAMARFTAVNRIRVTDLDLRYASNSWRTSGDAEAIAKDWRDCGMFAPGPAPAASSRSDGVSLIESMESIADNVDSDVKKKLAEVLLKTEGPDRFWTRFLGAFMANNQAAAFAELDRESAAISKWPPHCREGLARTILKWFPQAENTAGGGIKRLLADSRRQGDSESRKLAETYLKDGFPQDLHPYSLGNTFGGMMRRLITDDTRMAVKVWVKVLEHFEASRSGFSSNSNGFSRSAMQYASSELLQAYGNGTGPLPALAEFVVLLEKEKPGATAGMFDSNSGYYLRQVFGNYQQAAKASIAGDKSLAALKPEVREFAGLMMMLLRDTEKETRPVLANMYLMNAIYNSSSIGDTTRTLTLEWTRKDLKKLDSELANATVLSMVSRSEKDPEDQQREAREAFVSIIKDQRVPVMLRAGTVSTLMARNSGITWIDNPSCSSALADLLVGIVGGGPHWASSSSIGCFTKFSQLKSVSAADAARVVSAVKANPPEIGQGSSTNEASSVMARFMLPLALRAGDKDEISRIVKGSGETFRGNLDFAIQLWQGNYPEAAASLIARPGEYHQGMRTLLVSSSSGSAGVPRFTREIEAGLSGWLASIPDPAQRFRVECVVSAAADAKDAQAPEKKRAERIGALVKRFPDEAPKPRISRNEALAALGTEVEPARALCGEYVESVGKQSLGLLLPLRDGNSDNAREADASYVTDMIIRRAMRYALEEKGDLSLAVAQFESINPVPNGNQEYYAAEMLKEIGTGFTGILVRRLLELPVEKRVEPAKQALAISRTLIEKGRDESRRVGVALAIASQAAAVNGAALDTWLESLPKEVKESYDKSASAEGLKYCMQSMKFDELSGKEGDAPRRELLKGILTDPAISKRVIRHMTDISSIMDSGAFSREDVFAVIDSLPETFPRRAEYLCEKAGIMGWRGDKPEDALTAYDVAEAAAGSNAKAADYVKSYRAMFLDYKKRLDDALVVAKTIQLDHLPARERKTVEGILKKGADKEKQE